MDDLDDSLGPPPEESVRFCEQPAGRFPEVADMYREHLRENSDDPLPYMFLGEVTEWIVQDFVAHPGAGRWREIVEFLEEGYRLALAGRPSESTFYVENLIVMSFLDDLPTEESEPGFAIGEELGPNLRARWQRMLRGID